MCVCQAAERDWEEKRASLTQFSAQDINRLLEETQAELMKAIPDLDFAAKHINKPAVPPKPHITVPVTSTTATGPSAGPTGTTATTSTASVEQPGKVQLAAQKLNNLEGGGSHRGSGQYSGFYRAFIVCFRVLKAVLFYSGPGRGQVQN